ncbi:MAG: type II toxin-antitoxin system HicB family antitoxin [Gammaproteobacteria bacterium]|nr:type II toxin-antitoxin system HicB family antitoxin [Gammaproteobacteria bacterium]
MLSHKGYIGHVEFDEEAEIFHGEVINTRDVITFQGDSIKTIKKALVDSVEDYLAFCEERGESPERPFSGRFNVRIEPELHREAYIAAKQAGISLNSLIVEAIKHETKTMHTAR